MYIMTEVIDYNSDMEGVKINSLLPIEKFKNIILKKGTGGKKQFVENITQLLIAIYRNPTASELHNIIVPNDQGSIFMYYKEHQWHTGKLDDFIQTFFIRAYTMLSNIQKPFNYYMAFDDIDKKIYDDDPLRMMKHLNMFINDDDGYGWGDAKLITKKELTTSIKLFLICKHNMLNFTIPTPLQ
jgi:hypothetical protein